MQDKIKDIAPVIQHWIDSSEENYRSMHNLLKSKEYSWALFLGHLVLEKLLKALYVKKLHEHAIFKHDLLRLARMIELELPANFEEWLDEISTFNLNARYDNYKYNFSKLCTKEFTDNWTKIIELIRLWLIKQL